MNVWIRQISQLVGFGGACLALAAGALLGFSVPTMVVRALVVGGVLFAAVEILGRLAGETILGVAIEQTVRRQSRQTRASEDEPAAEAGAQRKRRARAA